mmetsp:Transcript_68518/g.193284  ORF Transcript_68518/g.193284 Transcript_68518/m.193284 type:complete len:205 (-) Transcript_68518:621-1235(-)
MRLSTTSFAIGSSQRTGISSKSTSLCDSLSCPDSRSHPQPCRNSPCMFMPDSGKSVSVLGSLQLVTFEKNSSVSMGIFVFLACSCSAAVMNPCGKKKEESQKLRGGPLVSHAVMKPMRRMKSATHELSGFMQGYATLPQVAGTFWIRKELNMPSMSADIRMMPLIACCSFLRLALTTLIIWPKREYSCPWKTPMETTPPPAIFL